MKAISDILTGGYAEPRALARQHDPRAVDEVARQFEAYFIQQMLKSMRKASFGDPIFGTDSAKFYQDLFDQQLSLALAAGKGIGFADLIRSQLAAAAGRPAPPAGDAEETSPTAPASPPSAPGGPSPQAAGLVPVARRSRPGRISALGPVSAPPPVAGADTGGASVGAEQPPGPEFSSPEQFVAALWPHAERAGAELGVNPQLLLAQSALETGWGRHVAPGPDGRTSSYNLFGLKADVRWSGPRVVKRTLEYHAGLMRQVEEPFRAYTSFAESFHDYVRFLRENPRYREALESAGSAEGFVRALQAAGYATDPDYADKVLGLLGREPIRLAPTRS